MILRQHLTTKSNDIPLGNLTYSTEHTEQVGVITHVGWKIHARYTGEDPKKGKQSYEIIFTPDEAREHLARLQDMLKRFDDEALVQEKLDQRAAEVVSGGE